MSRRAHRLLAGLILAGASVSAAAQMQLPGAMNGAAPGGPAKSSGGGAVTGGPTPAPLRPVVIKPPAEETILGKPLSRDGKSGSMTFDKAGDGVALSKLSLAGDKISKPQETCSVDVALPTPVVAKAEGRPAGAIRYEVPLDACPFKIDVLDGAALVSTALPNCDFKAADCKVTPGGLWGPHAADISAKQAKDLERQRPRIETTMRTNYKALIRQAGKDRAAVKALARDQAAFSSEREMTCRDYDQESVHGFCSTQITEARALALLAAFGPPDAKSGEHKSGERKSGEHKHVRARPKAAPAATGDAPAPDAPAPQPTEPQ